MQITLRTQPAPTLPTDIIGMLDDMNPRVFMRWNSRHEKGWYDKYSGRWEIWCEFTDTTHPDAADDRADSDVWNSQAGCWMRKLQSYTNEDGSFAPIDERLVIGLGMADTWANRRFYEDHIANPYDQQEDEKTRSREQIYADGAQYFKHFDRTLVGRHSRSADWRWRHR